ncbi:hypothetical protein QNH10_16580 [Sporosarcina thermotolerans]|uniref:hypothetical protein n=1 Tax=Sporosarcina thermotolerans TaxID=633404 RepID=UPI0024BD184F|nr:hypothetical protein [Sporosarcina thermotolerans]WHT47720.1 hypothetical protein QNH10_16580 [Sporosarcina thermotolerans]
MKSYYYRLLLAFTVIFLIQLTGLGIVLGQFFYLIDHPISTQVQHKYLLFLAVTFSIVFFISIFIASRVIRQYTKPIDFMTRTARKLAEGDYLARTPIEEIGIDNELGLALNQIAKTYRKLQFYGRWKRND